MALAPARGRDRGGRGARRRVVDDLGPRRVAVPRRLRPHRAPRRDRHRQRHTLRSRSARPRALRATAALHRLDLVRALSLALADLRVLEPRPDGPRRMVAPRGPPRDHPRRRGRVVLARRAADPPRRSARLDGKGRDPCRRGGARAGPRRVDGAPRARAVPGALRVAVATAARRAADPAPECETRRVEEWARAHRRAGHPAAARDARRRLGRAQHGPGHHGRDRGAPLLVLGHAGSPPTSATAGSTSGEASTRSASPDGAIAGRAS